MCKTFYTFKYNFCNTFCMITKQTDRTKKVFLCKVDVSLINYSFTMFTQCLTLDVDDSWVSVPDWLYHNIRLRFIITPQLTLSKAGAVTPLSWYLIVERGGRGLDRTSLNIHYSECSDHTRRKLIDSDLMGWKFT